MFRLGYACQYYRTSRLGYAECLDYAEWLRMWATPVSMILRKGVPRFKHPRVMRALGRRLSVSSYEKLREACHVLSTPPLGIPLSLHGVSLIDELSGRGTTRLEDAQGTPTQSRTSPSILLYEENNNALVSTKWPWSRAKKSDGSERRTGVTNDLAGLFRNGTTLRGLCAEQSGWARCQLVWRT